MGNGKKKLCFGRTDGWEEDLWLIDVDKLLRINRQKYKALLNFASIYKQYTKDGVLHNCAPKDKGTEQAQREAFFKYYYSIIYIN